MTLSRIVFVRHHDQQVLRFHHDDLLLYFQVPML
jgi:hypothetical protein